MQIERHVQRHGNLLKLGRRRLLLFRIENNGDGGVVLHLVEGGRRLRAWLQSRKPFETWVLENGRRREAFRVGDGRLEPLATA